MMISDTSQLGRKFDSNNIVEVLQLGDGALRALGPRHESGTGRIRSVDMPWDPINPRANIGDMDAHDACALVNDLIGKVAAMRQENAALTARLDRSNRSARMARKELEAMRAAAAAPAGT